MKKQRCKVRYAHHLSVVNLYKTLIAMNIWLEMLEMTDIALWVST